MRQKRNISSLQTIIKREEETIWDFTREVQASRPAGRGLQHECNPSKLREKLRAIFPFLSLTVFRLVGYNGRIVQTDKYIQRWKIIYEQQLKLSFSQASRLEVISRRGRSRLSPGKVRAKTGSDPETRHRKRGSPSNSLP